MTDERGISATHLREVLNEAPDGIVVVDGKGTLTFVNNTATAMFGYSGRELLGRPVEVLVPDAFREAHAQHRAEYRARPYVRQMGELVNIAGISKTGEVFPLDIKLSPIGRGKDFQVTAIIRDARSYRQMKDRLEKHASSLTRMNAEMRVLMGELEEKKQKLERASAQRTLILGVTAHDLRDPLAAILGYAKVLHEGLLGEINPQQRDATERIRRQSDYILRLVNDLLDVASIEAGQFRIEQTELDMVRLLQDVVTVERIAADERSLRIVLNHDQEELALKGDPVKLEQAIRNIIGNAVKFAPSDSTVRVGLSLDDGFAAIRVHNEGPVVPDEVREHIFDPFTSGSAESPSQHRGAGLGLTIARTIALGHGGDIHLEPSGQSGATFVFRLPIK